MDNIIQYIKNEKEEIEKKLEILNAKILNSKYSVEEIENAINNLTKNIDTTYEIFSPNSFNKDYNILEIEKLNLKKNEILLNVDSVIDEQKKLTDKKNKIEKVLNDLFKVEKEILTHNDNTKYLIKKENEKIHKEYVSNITNILEYQINKQDNYINRNLKKELDLLSNKINLCQNFIDMDINRAKLELIKLQENINTLNKKIYLEMFHVKHCEDNNQKLSLYEEIKKFIIEFKKSTDFKVDYKYTGNKINVSNIYIINTIRIMIEALENSVIHSKGNIITIDVVVDELNNSEEIKENLDNSDDMHQINFELEDESLTNVNIKISDNGNGFNTQNDNVLISNNMYGIYLMKQRIKNINGILDIKAEEGIGTTVSIVYEV